MLKNKSKGLYMLEMAKKITKTNKVVTLYQKWNDQVHETEFCAPIVNMFMEHIGCDCILYHYQAEFHDNSKLWLYAVFAEIRESVVTQNGIRKEGGGLWICKTDDIECQPIDFVSGDFQYKMISKDAPYEKFLKWDLSNGIEDFWNNTVDVSIGEERLRLRFLDK